MKANTVAHIEISEIRDGLFHARCPELGITATGQTMPEAESALMRMLDERTEQLGGHRAPPVLHAQQDTRVQMEED